MTESESDGSEAPAAARMQLEPKTVHEGEGEPAIDCPQCGATVDISRIIEVGRCTGYVEGDEMEADEDGERPREGGCGAELALELVWEE